MNVTKQTANFLLNYITGTSAPYYYYGTSSSYINSYSRYLALAYDVTYDDAGNIVSYVEPDSALGYARVSIGTSSFNANTFDNENGVYSFTNSKEFTYGTATSTYPHEIRYFLITTTSSRGSAISTIVYVGELQKTEQTWYIYGSDVQKAYTQQTVTDDQTGETTTVNVLDKAQSQLINQGLPVQNLVAFDPDLEYFYLGADGVYAKVNQKRTVATYSQIDVSTYNGTTGEKPVLFTQAQAGIYILVTDTSSLDWDNTTYYTAQYTEEAVSPSSFGGYLYVGLPRTGYKYIQPEKYTKPVVTAGSITISVK